MRTTSWLIMGGIAIGSLMYFAPSPKVEKQDFILLSVDDILEDWYRTSTYKLQVQPDSIVSSGTTLKALYGLRKDIERYTVQAYLRQKNYDSNMIKISDLLHFLDRKGFHHEAIEQDVMVQHLHLGHLTSGTVRV